MPPDSTRRSGRIPKEVSITLIGSDIEGRVFSERTKTVVLSRHGAGITSTFKLSPEQELVVRNEESRTEIEGRVVGQIGSDGDTYIYGVAFPDREIDFWGIEFPDLSETERRASQTLLECSSCRTRETADHSDLASDVMAINESIVRYCQRCGSSTLWKQALSGTNADASRASTRSEDRGVATDGPLQVIEPGLDSPEEDVSLSEEGALEMRQRAEPPVAPVAWRDGKRPTAAPQTPTSFAGAAWIEAETPQHRPKSVAETEPSSSDAENLTLPTKNARDVATARTGSSDLTSSPAAPKERENRRKYVRTRVNLKACIRREGQPDEVVVCEDMSRGGMRFESDKKYVEKMLIQVAVPYSPGEQAIFVPAQIAYVQELPEQKKHRCGVTYLRADKYQQT